MAEIDYRERLVALQALEELDSAFVTDHVLGQVEVGQLHGG